MSEQLSLPVEIRPRQEVSWYNAFQRRNWLGRVSIVNLIEGGTLKQSKIDVENISDLTDPNLRYALRFAAAANAVGFTYDAPNSSYSHSVSVTSTDEGLESHLLSAEYTGVVKNGIDTFMQDLHRQAPQPEVPGMASVRVAGVNGNPDTRFWVISH